MGKRSERDRTEPNRTVQPVDGRRLSRRRLEPVGVLLCALAVYLTTAYIEHAQDAKQSVNFVLLVVAAAAVFRSVWAFGAVLVLTVGGFLFAWEASSPASGDWGFYSYAVFVAAALAVAIFAVRRTALRNLEEARAGLRRMAVVDELTGLHNRRGFLVLAEQVRLDAERHGESFTLLFVDVDRMKEINDRFGHLSGDAALQETASLLRATFRGADVVARLGGDEFCVLLSLAKPGVSYADRLRSSVIEANARTDRRFTLSLSVGEAYYDPQRPCDLEELITRSDKAMYDDKLAHR